MEEAGARTGRMRRAVFRGFVIVGRHLGTKGNIVRDVCRRYERRTLLKPERDAILQEQPRHKVAARRHDKRAAAACARLVDGALKGLGLQRTVRLGSIVRNRCSRCAGHHQDHGEPGSSTISPDDERHDQLQNFDGSRNACVLTGRSLGTPAGTHTTRRISS